MHSLVALSLLCVASAPAYAQKRVRLSLDWLVQSTHAPFFIAREKGYFKEAGVTVDAIDPGRGATNVAISLASGAYDMGWVDMPSMINFNAKNPNNPLIAVYISFDATPLAVIARKDAGIRTPADLHGKKIAGGAGGAGHDTVSILLKAARAEHVKIEWVPIAIEMTGAMVKSGAVAGTIAFTNSNVPAMLGVGLKREDLTVLKYSDFGADLYSLALTATKRFVEQNPDTVRAVVKGLNRGMKDTIANPAAALTLMKDLDPMMKESVEKVRLDLALEVMKTPHVVKNGLSSVDPRKLQFTIDSIADAYNLKERPAPETIYTDRFLPPENERALAATN